MSSWVGYAVSVNCGEPLGCYQGTIVETDGSTITLTKAFRNGFPYPKSKVTLNAVDIKELKIIEESQSAPAEQTHSTVSVTKSNKKGQRATVCENLQANPSNLVNTVSNVSGVQPGGAGSAGPCRSKPIDIQGPRNNKNISHSAVYNMGCVAGLRGWAGGAALVLLARAAADVALQLVGGGRRLDWRNAHQAPVCVAVAGPHRTGAAAVLAARLLASHGARAFVLLAGECGQCGQCGRCGEGEQCGEGGQCGAGAVRREVRALGAGCVRRADELPRPDLVLLALHDPERAADADAEHAQPRYQEALTWARGARGAALALEPPACGWAGLSARAAVQGVLPGAVPAALGRLHLADVAPPPALFRDLGIQYRTPFAAGALLPLHPAD
ncbi:Enhancer of mRNA-decapping protein 3 [Papilio xuthus]|uniref:Enhancer of mRNA-decapping protein 3 n=1 Tax=Papilio xuthus TaxID=66420 RepID=A0A0N1I2W7_PAPXU|nr:Enhancer of mRNA-decapping protein 3 [Papilio xuthus]